MPVPCSGSRGGVLVGGHRSTPAAAGVLATVLTEMLAEILAASDLAAVSHCSGA